MELIIGGLFAVLLLIIAIKLFKVTFKVGFKLLVNGFFGLIALIIFNVFGHLLGIPLDITILHSLIAGFFGMPGIIVLLIIKYII